MKSVALLLIVVSSCLGSEISGAWRLKHTAADVPFFPIAVEVERCGSDLQVIKVIAAPDGKHLQQLWLHAAAIRVISGGTEFTVGAETWTITADDELTIQEADGQRLVLERSEGVVQ